MHNNIKQFIATALEIDVKDVVLERPKEQKFGHYATPLAFVLAKQLRKNPKEIAMELAEKLRLKDKKSPQSLFDEILPIGGFVNFRLCADVLADLCEKALKAQKDFGKQNNTQRVLLEFVSANPTGPLHIGHARGAIWGDSLARIGKHLGYLITKEYYVNDAGNQIHLLGLSIYLAAREIMGLDVCYPEQYYRGGYIMEIAQKALAKWGNDWVLSEDSIPQLAIFGKDLMLAEIKSNLEQVRIDFDHFVSEKALYAEWDKTLSQLRNSQSVYEQDSKIWLKTEQFGDKEDRVIVRENGEPTYLAGDIIYHHDKFMRPFDSYINIWGADHHGYIARVKAAIEWLGFDSARLEVLLSQMVTLLKGGEPYKMSKRAGNFILMSDVVADVGADALRFVFLSKKNDTHLEFDVEEIKQEDSNNPVYYINYAHARIHTLLERSTKTQEQIDSVSILPLLRAEDTSLKQDSMDLLFLSLQLSQVIEDSFHSRNLVKMSDYLKHLAACFHHFYNAHKILHSALELEILKLTQMVSLALSLGLELLGIEAKKSMSKQSAERKD